MRLVLKIDQATSANKECVRKLANAVAHLLRDGHGLVIIAADRSECKESIGPAESPVVNGNGHQNGRTVGTAPAIQESRLVAAHLSHAGIAGIALNGADAGICRLRRTYLNASNTPSGVEISSVDPHWINLICSNGGVPVISNWVVDISGEFQVANSDHMASVCAVAWNADALIYITDGKGVINANGTVARWLNMAENDDHQKLSRGAISESILNGCRQALQRGVRRARILPVASLDSLPLFYITRIEDGTEVVLAIGQRPLSNSGYSMKSGSF